MNEALKTCCPTTCAATPSAISSPASADGHLLFGQPVSVIVSLFGPEVARASLSARQAKAAGLLTSGTCGRHGITSSASAALQSSLESRLRAVLPVSGSTLYRMTWKGWATPSGRSRFRLRGSALRTSETDFTGWRTPNTVDAKLGNRVGLGQVQLCHQALLAGWPTCTVQDPRPWDTGRPLGQVAALTRMDQPARFTATGVMLTGSSAGMVSGGQLRPAHSRWLMGYPQEWDACAVMAMPSSRKRPPRSSGPA